LGQRPVHLVALAQKIDLAEANSGEAGACQLQKVTATNARHGGFWK
jgi:hypothetical protein